MDTDVLTVALITDVFHGIRGADRLASRLAEAKALGADLALLPELPLDPWVPSSTIARDEDAEPPEGPRHQALSRAAQMARVGVVGGAIVRDPATGLRHNTALVFDAAGQLVGHYRKVHLPEEEGYWETSHYVPGDEVPTPVDAFTVPFGIQICSDVNRPVGSSLLSAMGAEVILAPRATPPETYERWRLILRASAITSTTYVVSANRPYPEGGASIGGPSVAVAPNGRMLVETTDPVAVVELRRSVVHDARRQYPGYLAHPSDLYARGWRAVAFAAEIGSDPISWIGRNGV